MFLRYADLSISAGHDPKYDLLKEVTMAVFQCPVCELRFALAAELEDHVDSAHPDFNVEPKSVEDEMISKVKRRRRESDRRT